MRLPSPRFQRLATLAAIDADEKVALLPSSSHPTAGWSLPRCLVRAHETYAEAAARLAADCFQSRPLRWGTVVGRRWAPPPGGAPRVRVEEHVFLARTGAHQSSNSALLWTARGNLSSYLLERHADTTASLVDGYLDGWIPDGSIRLY